LPKLLEIGTQSGRTPVAINIKIKLIFGSAKIISSDFIG